MGLFSKKRNTKTTNNSRKIKSLPMGPVTVGDIHDTLAWVKDYVAGADIKHYTFDLPLVVSESDAVSLQYSGNLLVDDGYLKVDADSTPTEDSTKLITSGGVYTALEGKQDNIGIIDGSTFTYESTKSIYMLYNNTAMDEPVGANSFTTFNGTLVGWQLTAEEIANMDVISVSYLWKNNSNTNLVYYVNKFDLTNMTVSLTVFNPTIVTQDVNEYPFFRVVYKPKNA